MLLRPCCAASEIEIDAQVTIEVFTEVPNAVMSEDWSGQTICRSPSSSRRQNAPSQVRHDYPALAWCSSRCGVSTMDRRHSLVLAITICGAVSTQACAVERQKVRVPGIYSSLVYSEEGGDLLGTEIFIVPSDLANLAYVVFVQCWEGGSTPPVTVPVKVSGDSISFTVPGPSCAEGTYKGRISKAGFDGTFMRRLVDGTSKAEPVHLKRKPSYWQ
jgi:hypothetical protein